LYVVDTFQPEQVDNVSEIKRRAEELDGDIVTVKTRFNQLRVSIQETVEHVTGCNEGVLKIQTPEGPVCVNVGQDNLVHGGVMWNTIPTSSEQILLTTGISSSHLDAPVGVQRGRYQVTGKVVSSTRVDSQYPRLGDALPNRTVFVLYELERLSQIDYRDLGNESKALIENRTRLIVPSRAALLNSTTRELLKGSVAQLARLSNTTSLNQSQTRPRSLSGSIRAEGEAAADIAVGLRENTSATYSLDINSTENATNVTIYIQRSSVPPAADGGDLSMYLDGKEHPFSLINGPDRRWIAFNVPAFSQRHVTFTTSQQPVVSAAVTSGVNNAGSPFILQINVSDADGRVSKIRVQGNGQELTTKRCGKKTCRFSVMGVIGESTWNRTADAYEPLPLRVTAEDNASVEQETLTNITLYKAGDATRDGTVDIRDAVVVGRAWRTIRADTDYTDAADLNNDGSIDIFDAVLIGRNWESTEPSAVS
jgi:hypothetical protein